ncbi:thioredoxin family protein [Thalassobacillus hwangdonensis]|uniref:Thioredoxin family protein n=1 Tax=Thalassobacillus hwangdonensis TaxID=546108 RepID=A0ABW3L606_9BACI
MRQLTLESNDHTLLDNDWMYIFIQSPFCGTCQLASKMLETVERTYNRNLFYDLNASLHPDLMQQYEIESVPCLLVIHNGTIKEKIYAFHSVPYLYELMSKYV